MSTKSDEVTLQYFKNLAINHVCKPGIRIPIKKLKNFLKLEENKGSQSISIADTMKPFQISLPLYIGATSPAANKKEEAHWRNDQAESYVIIKGKAKLYAMYRWAKGFRVLEAEEGDTLVVQPQVCHWFQFTSKNGLAMVFKAPQQAGKGLPPKGKTTCGDEDYDDKCPHTDECPLRPVYKKMRSVPP